MEDYSNLKFENHSDKFNSGKLDGDENPTVSHPMQNSLGHLESGEEKQLSELLEEGEQSDRIENFNADIFLKELHQKYLKLI